MRVNFRAKFGNMTFFVMLSRYQKLEGITNEYDKKKRLFYPFWDIEGCSLEECKKSLDNIMLSYDLGDIFITTDNDKTYRAWSWYPIKWKTYLKVLLDTEFLDYNFFFWTVKRGYATLRTSLKEGRQEQRVVAMIKSDLDLKPVFLKETTSITYDTGIEKQGRFINIG